MEMLCEVLPTDTRKEWIPAIFVCCHIIWACFQIDACLPHASDFVLLLLSFVRIFALQTFKAKIQIIMHNQAGTLSGLLCVYACVWVSCARICRNRNHFIINRQFFRFVVVILLISHHRSRWFFWLCIICATFMYEYGNLLNISVICEQTTTRLLVQRSFFWSHILHCWISGT